MPADREWTPYPHEEVRVHLLWRKRILLGLLVGALFLMWALSLGVQTETEEQLEIYGGDGSSIQINRPDEQQRTEPAASVTLRPGETARLNEDLTVNDTSQRQGERSGATVPERPSGIPFVGILMVLAPFLAAIAAWRYLGEEGTSIEVNYGVYKGSMPLEMITATHAKHLYTGSELHENPFGKVRSDYLREAMNDPARDHGPVFGPATRR